MGPHEGERMAEQFDAVEEFWAARKHLEKSAFVRTFPHPFLVESDDAFIAARILITTPTAGEAPQLLTSPIEAGASTSELWRGGIVGRYILLGK